MDQATGINNCAAGLLYFKQRHLGRGQYCYIFVITSHRLIRVIRTVELEGLQGGVGPIRNEVAKCLKIRAESWYNSDYYLIFRNVQDTGIFTIDGSMARD